MELSEYQELARTTAKFSKHPASLEGFPTAFSATNDAIDATFEYTNFVYTILGLTGEAGEIANKVKKIWRDGGGVITEEHDKTLADEFGDVLWYLATSASQLGLDLNEIAKRNIEKLKSRAERNVISGSGDNR